MNVRQIEKGASSFSISWENGSQSEHFFIWLRDNDENELHPETRERIFDLGSVAIEIQPQRYELTDNFLEILWPGKQDPSLYKLDWLYEHRPGQLRSDPASIEKKYWVAKELPQIPRFEALACEAQTTTLAAALRTLKQIGIIIIEKLKDDQSSGEEFGDLIGFKRQSNFDTLFDVINKPEPNNLAYTSIALPLHTDLPNQSLVPGYQFLHCFRNEVSGGKSVFADGFQICRDLAEEDPEKFELLSSISVPWRFHDQHCDIRAHRPVIGLNANSELSSFVFNAHIADIPDMPGNTLPKFYTAYRDLMLRIREPKYAVQHLLRSGEMVIFDNRRLLHSRTAFDPKQGARHLRGYYIESDEVDSCIRMKSSDNLISAY